LISFAHGFRSRLLLVFSAGFLMLLFMGAYGLMLHRELLTRLNEEQQRAARQLRLAREIEVHYVQQNLAWANLLLRGRDPGQYHHYLATFYEHERQTLERAERLLQQLATQEAPRELTARFAASLGQLRAQYRQALRIYNASKHSEEATDQFLSAITRKPTEMLADIEKLLLEQHEATQQELYRSVRADELSLALVSTAILAAWLLFVLWFLDRNFAKPMAQAIRTARQVAAGRMSERFDAVHSGEFGAFAEAFNVMLERLARSNEELASSVERLRAEIAQREQAEQELRVQQLALASANRELEAFSYTASHDLRAPLRAIDGFTRLLEERCGDALDREGRGHLARVRGAARRMGQLIDDLLAFSRAGKIELRERSVDLGALARSVAQELRAAAPERQVAWRIADGLGAHVDEQLMRVVLQNLLGNALKFTARTRRAVIEFDAPAAGTFRVRDNGAGFDPAYADTLFRPFRRLHSAHEFEGSGIGLATVRRIIERHGGSVRAEGAIGAGAAFYFTLPRSAEEGRGQ
jgi:signal transduction histidine kinase